MAKYDGQFIRLTSFSFHELREKFSQAPPISDSRECSTCGIPIDLPRCFYVEEIGVLAITNDHEAAINFLLMAISHEDKFVRYNAYGHLGNVRTPKKRETIATAVENGIENEKDERVLEIAVISLAKLKSV